MFVHRRPRFRTEGRPTLNPVVNRLHWQARRTKPLDHMEMCQSRKLTGICFWNEEVIHSFISSFIHTRRRCVIRAAMIEVSKSMSLDILYLRDVNRVMNRIRKIRKSRDGSRCGFRGSRCWCSEAAKNRRQDTIAGQEEHCDDKRVCGLRALHDSLRRWIDSR